MSNFIGNIFTIVLGIVAVVIALKLVFFLLGLVGIVIGVSFLLIKLAILGGLLYLVWTVLAKLFARKDSAF